MGITRMVGVDSTFNDPNSFGATIVLSLPIAYALLRLENNKYMKCLYYFYFAISLYCIVLTGSRTAFAALVVLTCFYVMYQKGSRRLVLVVVILISSVTFWNIIPYEKQDRFRTLWDNEAGPANARESAEGRMEGWKVSWRMFQQRPLTGVGAGGRNFIGYRVANSVDDENPSATQAHILYGEVLAELGIVGAILLTGLVVSTCRSCKKVMNSHKSEDDINIFNYYLSRAIIVTLALLLIFGFGGHNFYRPLWLWLAAWSGCLLTLSMTTSNSSVQSRLIGM
jgi:O-antigen ligase